MLREWTVFVGIPQNIVGKYRANACRGGHSDSASLPTISPAAAWDTSAARAAATPGPCGRVHKCATFRPVPSRRVATRSTSMVARMKLRSALLTLAVATSLAACDGPETYPFEGKWELPNPNAPGLGFCAHAPRISISSKHIVFPLGLSPSRKSKAKTDNGYSIPARTENPWSRRS